MKKVLIAYILASICQITKAQSANDVIFANLQSANIASLGVYGETPVSLSTGTANISIPIYELTTYGENIPISLSYHTASIKPDQHPGWVGLGWNLSAGGAIYRVVNDLSDDLSELNTYGFYHKDSNNNHLYSYLDNNQWNTKSFITSIAHNTSLTINDTEPDEFSFNFLGYSGKFFLDHHGEWKVQCNRHVKVELLEDRYPKPNCLRLNSYMNLTAEGPTFGGFKIIGEDGTEYIFGCTDNSIEYSRELFWQQYGCWTANAWYLTKIIYPNKKEVIFNYCRESTQVQLFNSISQYQKYANGIGWLHPGCSSFNYNSYLDLGNNGIIISPVYLNNIEYENMNISFFHSESSELPIKQNCLAHAYQVHYNDMSPIYTFSEDGYHLSDIESLKWQKLDKITIRNADNSFVKDFLFDYNNTNLERLALQSVKLYNGEEYIGKYDFTYNSIGSLPDYLALKNDHWGYYNGNEDDFSSGLNTFIGTREPNSTCMMYGLLTKIKYPTGGYSRYIFEPNTYRKAANTQHDLEEITYDANLVAGGARIKEIVRSDTGKEQDEYSYKNYVYSSIVDSDVSSGVLCTPIQYTDTMDINVDNYHLLIMEMRSQSVLPASKSGASSNILYSDVIEINNDGSYSKYHFSNFDNGHRNEQCCSMIIEERNKYAKFNNKAVERGLLLNKNTYTANHQLLNKTIFSYKKDKEQDNYVRSIFSKFYNICPNSADSWYDAQAYKVYTYSMLQDSIINTVYENGDSITTLTKLEYNDHNQMISKEVSRCGETIKDEYSYVTDIVGAYGNSISPYNSMYNLNMLLPVEHVHYRNNSPATAQLTTYKNDGHSFVPKAKYEQKVVNGSFSHYTGCDVSSAYGSPEIVFENYNDMSQPTMFMDRDSVYSAIIYKGIHPAMVVKNAHDMEILDDSHVTTNSERLDFYKCASQSTYTFSMNTDGEFNINLVPSESVTSWRITGTIDYQHPFTLLYNQSEGVGEPWDSYWGGNSFSVNLSAGVHQFIIREIETYPSFSSNEPHAYITYRYPELIPGTLKMCEAFYEDFDDEGNSNDGFLGTKCHTGSYTPDVCFRDSREYFIDYLIWENGSWKYRKEDFTGSLSCSSRIDNVRIYPKDSQVMSYTFDDGIGMTSQTDGKGVITYYRYDKAGRLIEESDSFHGITNSYEYNYGH